MPIRAIDYSKNINYKFVCNDLTIPDVYVGHSSNFTKRKYAHKDNTEHPASRAYHLPVYEFIRNNGGWSNWKMIEIEKYPCIDGNEARARERHWVEQLGATLNDRIPNRNWQEYQITNRERLYEEKKRVHTCECGMTYTEGHKARHTKTIFHINKISII
jgi:hypothetical protein